jgi:short-subunit dehydrogenase
MNETKKKPVCVVIGVAIGGGEAFVRGFAKAGYALALVSRDPARFSRGLAASLATNLVDVHAYACDVTDAALVQQTFARIQAELGAIDVVIYNPGRSAWGSIEKVTAADFEAAFRVNALGLFIVAQEIVPYMKERAQGNLIVIGATASRRGSAGMAAFAAGKAAQRSLAESLGRHLGPMGIHVALMVVDGVVAQSEVSKLFPERPADTFIDPNALAETALQIVRQDRSAWSFEVEVRPFNEKW